MKRIEKECLGCCPKCNSIDIDYRGSEPLDETYIYKCYCKNCATYFTEEYVLKYNVSYYDEEN